MDIIFENNDMLIIKKKAGQLVQSNKSFDLDLTSEVMGYRRKKGEEAYAAVINRLDRPVSGLVLFAKNKKAATRLSKLMQTEGFCKHYYALVSGKMSEETGTLVDYLLKDGKNNTSSVVSECVKDAKRAELEYRVIKYLEDKDCSLVDIHLITGRHHQIRVQFASRNHALLGDMKYGNTEFRKGEIALCAYSMKIEKKVYECSPEWLG